MRNVPVVMLVAAVAVLIGVIIVAVGRGGELAYFPADYAPLRLDEVSATDVVLFRPPLTLLGYNAPATDEALNRIADALTERDIEISALRHQVETLQESAGRWPLGDTDPPGRPGGRAEAGPGDRSGGGPGDRLTGSPGPGPGQPTGTGWADPAAPAPPARRAGPFPDAPFPDVPPPGERGERPPGALSSGPPGGPSAEAPPLGSRGGPSAEAPPLGSRGEPAPAAPRPGPREREFPEAQGSGLRERELPEAPRFGTKGRETFEAPDPGPGNRYPEAPGFGPDDRAAPGTGSARASAGELPRRPPSGDRPALPGGGRPADPPADPPAGPSQYSLPKHPQGSAPGFDVFAPHSPLRRTEDDPFGDHAPVLPAREGDLSDPFVSNWPDHPDRPGQADPPAAPGLRADDEGETR